MKDWDGVDRRQDHNMEDHDLLIEIKGIVLAQKEVSENHFSGFKEHLISDKDDFEKVHKRINKLSWYAALGAGVVFALEFFKEKIFKP